MDYNRVSLNTTINIKPVNKAMYVNKHKVGLMFRILRPA